MNHFSNRLALAFCIFSFTSSAHSQANTGKNASKQEQPAALQDQEQRIQALEAQLKFLQSRVPYKYASLDCNGGKYDELQAAGGTLVFFVACTKVEPFLEGHRIILRPRAKIT
jgi:hypothetical protein